MNRTIKIRNLTARVRAKLFQLELPAVRLMVLVAAIFVVLLISRFAYLPFMLDDIEGNFFGFRWLSAFLYALGVEFFILCLGILMYVSTHFMLEGARPYFQKISLVIISISLYFVCWVFLSPLSFKVELEVLFSLIASLGLTYVLVKFMKFIKAFHIRQKAIISDMLDDMIDSAPRYMNDRDLERYDEEVLVPRIRKVSDELHK